MSGCQPKTTEILNPSIGRHISRSLKEPTISVAPTLGDIRSPKLVNWDISFEKLTALCAKANLSVRFELIDLFNGVNWVGPRSA